MHIQEGTLRFDCSKAMDAFKFDEEERSKPHFHGLSHCMKAVDFIVEFPGYYVFIEVKAPPDKHHFNSKESQKELMHNLVVKFRDTLLYRWAESKLDKPVHYLCLIEMDNALILRMNKIRKQKLPVVKIPKCWKRALADTCAVLNSQRWNQQFPDLPVSRMNGDAS